MFKIRFISGALLSAGICLILAFSDIPAVLNSAIAVINLLAVNELYRAAKIKNRKGMYAISAAAVIFSYIYIENYTFGLLLLYVEIMIVSVYLMRSIEKQRTLEVWVTLNMALFIMASFKTMSYVRELDYGLVLLAGTILLCFVLDISAYIVGSCFGKRKLAPRISPGKTVGGSVGAVVVTMCVFMSIALICQNYTTVVFDYKALAIYLIVASVLGQFGDLTMSSIKRRVWIKDYSKLIPGHGGILDRFDSLIFVLPFTYIYVESGGTFVM